jgi:hypothetical protein
MSAMMDMDLMDGFEVKTNEQEGGGAFAFGFV